MAGGTPRLIAPQPVTIHPLQVAATLVDKRSRTGAPAPSYTDPVELVGQLDFGEHKSKNQAGSIATTEKHTASLALRVRDCEAVGYTPRRGDRVQPSTGAAATTTLYVDEARPSAPGRLSGKHTLWIIRLIDRSHTRPAAP